MSQRTAVPPSPRQRVEIRPQPGPQTSFLTNPADICIYGGAAGGGETWALLLDPLREISRNKDFGAVIFRRTSPQITNEGGLWDEAGKIYPYIRGVPKIGNLEYTFPLGGRIAFHHLQHDKNMFDWQGAQIPEIGFDELTHFTEAQFWYMLSRNRSTCGVQPFMRATCNADADSWVAKLIAWWIDEETGYPIMERAGVLRWFVRVNDQLEWASDQAALREKYPDTPSKSLSFIPAKLADNPALMRSDPGYLANLLALPLVERERLLGGNWRIRAAAGLVFNRGWFEIVRAAPVQASRVRYWDKAGTQGAGDWSCGVRMARSEEGLFYVENVVRGQWSSLERNRVMIQTALADGEGVEIWIEQEPGSGGKESAEISVRQLAGFSVHAESVTGDKESRARGMSAQAEAGNVKIVQGGWNEAYLSELHGFPLAANDDQVDASTGGFNKLVLSHWGDWEPEENDRRSPTERLIDADVFLPERDGGDSFCMDE